MSKNYLSAVALSWDTILKTIKVVLEFFPDPEMHIIFKKKVGEAEFLIFLIDVAKPTISI